MISGCSKDGFSDWSRKVKIKLGEQDVEVLDENESTPSTPLQRSSSSSQANGKRHCFLAYSVPNLRKDGIFIGRELFRLHVLSLGSQTSTTSFIRSTKMAWLDKG